MKDKQNGLFQEPPQDTQRQPPSPPRYESQPEPKRLSEGYKIGFWSMIAILALVIELFAPVHFKPTTILWSWWINKVNLEKTGTMQAEADAEALKAKLVAEETAKVEQQKTFIITKFTSEFELYKNCTDQRRTMADQARAECMSNFDKTFSDCDLITYAIESKPCQEKPLLTKAEYELVGERLKGTLQ